MAHDLTTTSTPSRPVSLYSASNDQLAAILHGQCNQGRLVDDLRDILGLYYQPNETDGQRARQIALFVKDLADMSDATVQWALTEWRRTQDRRPMPATLRQLCMLRRSEASQQMASRQPKRSEADFRPEISDAERDRRKAVIAEVAAQCGMVKAGQQLAWPKNSEPEHRTPHWSETASPDDPRWQALNKARAANPLTRAPGDLK